MAEFRYATEKYAIGGNTYYRGVVIQRGGNVIYKSPSGWKSRETAKRMVKSEFRARTTKSNPIAKRKAVHKNPSMVPALLKKMKSGAYKVYVSAKHAVKLNPKSMDVPEKHMLKIARSTLKMSDVGARIMGGQTKEYARDVIRKYGGGQREIDRLEGKKENRRRKR